MTTSTKQRLLIAFSSVLVGCAVGATMPRLAAQSFPTNPSAQRWEQFCERIGGLSGDGSAAARERLNQTLAARGNEGFELVAASFEQRNQAWSELHVCFKRPLAR